MHLLSVIIPVYNTATYLNQCLDSIINQTYKNIEIICVNDGSTDNSLEILEQYAKIDNRIKILNKKNGGLASARNAGMKVANGDFLAFVDSDDYLDFDAYETAMNLIGNNDLLCFGIKVFGSTNQKQIISDENYYRIKFQGSKKINRRKAIVTDVSACNKIFKKDIINRNNICFPNGFYYEDAEFYFKYIVNCNNVYYLDKYFYNYRRSGNSIMAETFSGTPRALDHLLIVKHIFEYYDENKILMKNKQLFHRIFFDFFNFAYYNSDKDTKLKVLTVANEFAIEFNKKLNFRTNFIKSLTSKNYEDLYIPNYKWFQKIYRKKKFYNDITNTTIKLKYILGFKFLKKYSHPRVSVIMPVYNAENFLKESIDSILNQTFNDFEFIIINDGSTDNSAEIINGYEDKRIRFINNKDNKGLVSVLNYGLSIAKGEYIARMDADDKSYPERFQKQVEFLDKHKNIGILGSWYKTFGNTNSFIDEKLKYPKFSDMVINPLAHPTVMFRKHLFEKFDLLYNEHYKHAEDYELWVRASKHTKIANLQEVLLDYRWSESNISTKFEKEQIQCAEVIKQKVKNKLNKEKSLLNLFIDDTQILNELKNLKEFSYIPNSGNMGDMLIASSTMHWFDMNNLNWKRLKEGEIPEVLVYGGGGAWLKEWIEFLKPTMEMMKKCKKVIILPSSFNEVPEFINILDERFVVFCREKKSYDYLVSQNTKSKIILDHDMALRLKYYLSFKKAPTKELKKAAKRLEKNISKLSKNVKLFRIDSESKWRFKTDFDLSDALGWFSPYEPRKNIDFAAAEMLKILSKFDYISTDRLHVGIASILLAKDVQLWDNSYGKISGVYNQSLKGLPNVQYQNRGEK